MTTDNDLFSVEFITTADTIYIYHNNDFNKLITLRDNKSMTVSPGIHRFLIFGKNFPESDYLLEVKDEKKYKILLPEPRNPESISNENLATYARLLWNANLVIEPRSGYTVYVNDEIAGEGVITKNLPSGNHKITFRSATGARDIKFVTVQSHRLDYVTQLPEKAKVDNLKYILPGHAQFYKGEKLKGGLMMGGAAIFTVAAITNYLLAHSARKDFDGLRIRYHNENWNEENALKMGSRLEELRSTVNTRRTRGNLFLLSTALLYGINIIDANSEPRGGFSRINLLNPENNLSLDLNDNKATLSLKFNF